MVQWVIGLIPHCAPIELFFIPASTPRLVQQRMWDGAHKRTLTAIRSNSNNNTN